MLPFTGQFRYSRLISPFDATANFDHDLYGSICANYMVYLFASSKYLYPSPRSAWQEHLPKFIASALHHSGLDLSVLIIAMTYLCKYKEANIFSVAYDDDAYRLFFASYMIAAQTSSGYDDELRKVHLAPWNKVACGGKFTDDELLSIQATFRCALKGEVAVDPELYVIFQKIFRASTRSTGMTTRFSSTSTQYLHPGSESGVAHASPSTSHSMTPPPLYEETLARPKALCGSPISPARTASELEEEDRQILASLFFTSATVYPKRKASRPSIKQKFVHFFQRLDIRSSHRRRK